jgi:hypothetical protein
MKLSNKEVRPCVESLIPFKANNLYGEESKVNGVLVYAVYSYGYHFPIYAYSYKLNKWYGNKEKYSVSTSRHQSQARPLADIEYIPTAELQFRIAQG